MFNDIMSLLLWPTVFRDAIDLFVEWYRNMNITVVAGIEARGFIFTPPMALAIGTKFVPLCKPKKFPGTVISEDYKLEYGIDSLEIQVGVVEPGERVLVVDDMVVTSRILCAAMRLLECAGAEVVGCACLLGLPAYKECQKLNGKLAASLGNSKYNTRQVREVSADKATQD